MKSLFRAIVVLGVLSSVGLGSVSAQAAAAVKPVATPSSMNVKPVTAPAGMEVWLSEEHILPIVAVSISLPAGSGYDPSDKPGLAAMIAGLLDEGAGDLDANAFKQALQAKAIQFSAVAQRDYLVITLTTLSENADEAFRLLGLALSRPRFDREPIERTRTEMLAALKQDDEDPSTIAEKAFFSAYYGDHPYAHPVDGTAAGLMAITQQDVKTFAATYLVRGRARVSIAGDINETQVKKYIGDVFGQLPTKTPPLVSHPETVGHIGTQIIPMDVPQPAAMFGVPGPLRSDTTFIPAYVANYIFGGGGFSSRLMDQVREKMGLTYGIGSDLVDDRAAAMIMGTVESDKTKIKTALDTMKAEMTRFAKNGATAKELADAKTYLTGSFPLAFDSEVRIAAQLNGFQRNGLAVDYVTKRNALIQAVTLEQVNAAAKRYFLPERLTIVVAGTPVRAAPAKAP